MCALLPSYMWALGIQTPVPTLAGLNLLAELIPQLPIGSLLSISRTPGCFSSLVFCSPYLEIYRDLFAFLSFPPLFLPLWICSHHPPSQSARPIVRGTIHGLGPRLYNSKLSAKRTSKQGATRLSSLLVTVAVMIWGPALMSLQQWQKSGTVSQLNSLSVASCCPRCFLSGCFITSEVKLEHLVLNSLVFDFSLLEYNKCYVYIIWEGRLRQRAEGSEL